MDKLSNTYCEVCLRKGLQVKVRTICKDCREFLCKECSDTHLLHKFLMHHNLIDLDLPGENVGSADDDDLASDFLEQATISKTTALYRAQVAVENKKKEKLEKTQERKLKEEIDISELKGSKSQEFRATRPDDTESVCVTGILIIKPTDKRVIVDSNNRKLKLFDSGGNYLSSTNLLAQYTTGITVVDKDRFATCGSDYKVYMWSLCGNKIVREDETFDVDERAYGIHYNGTYYCVLHDSQSVTILERQGRRVRKIVLNESFGMKMEFGWDIHMDSNTHNIYIPCCPPDSGVLCVSVKGEVLWFTPLSDADLFGITAIRDKLCIAACRNRCLHLISATGQYMGKLLDKEDLQGRPVYIYFDAHKKNLCVGYNERDEINVFSL